MSGRWADQGVASGGEASWSATPRQVAVAGAVTAEFLRIARPHAEAGACRGSRPRTPESPADDRQPKPTQRTAPLLTAILTATVLPAFLAFASQGQSCGPASAARLPC